MTSWPFSCQESKLTRDDRVLLGYYKGHLRKKNIRLENFFRDFLSKIFLNLIVVIKNAKNFDCDKGNKVFEN